MEPLLVFLIGFNLLMPVLSFNRQPSMSFMRSNIYSMGMGYDTAGGMTSSNMAT